MTDLLCGPETVPMAHVQGALALDLTPLLEPPPLPGRHPGRPGGDVVPIETGHRRRIEQWAHRYAQAAVEIVAGDRPVTQLVRWTAPGVYADLARRAQLVARAGGHQAGLGRAGQVVRPQVQGVRSCFVTDARVEVSIHVRHGARSRAIAARFELLGDGRWMCTALEFA